MPRRCRWDQAVETRHSPSLPACSQAIPELPGSEQRERPLGREIPIIGKPTGANWNIVGVSFHLQDPVNVVRDLGGNIGQCKGQFLQLFLTAVTDAEAWP